MDKDDQVCGDWVELRELAAPGRLTFAPITADLPPARGRRRLVLDEGGMAAGGEPGADDRYHLEDAASWVREGDRLTITGGEFRGTYRIAEAGPERLVLEVQPHDR